METWKAVPGFEGRYEVSTQGRVRSVPNSVRAVSKAGRVYYRVAPGRTLKSGDCKGYRIVNLSGHGTIGVHILVAMAFVPGHFEGAEVNHKNGVKHHNVPDNLEWTTRKGNLLHAVDLGLNTQAVRVRCPQTGRVHPSITQAARAAGVHQRTVSAKWERVT